METRELRRNPYDWQTPVQDAKIFAGRKEELAEIDAEIGKLIATKPIIPTVAILGERKVGKTSLLLRVAELCNKNKIVPVLVSLEGQFASDTWEFWNEVLSRIMIALHSLDILSDDIEEKHMGFMPSSSQIGDMKEHKVTLGQLMFFEAYHLHFGTKQPRVPTYIIESDLKVLTKAILDGGLNGLLVILDEAHLLLGAQEVKEQIRHAVEKAGRIGLLFAGEAGVGEMFTNSSEPFYAHGRVISLKNYTSLDDVAECALSPLNEDEAELMNPMTVSYLGRLSQGKPNQIRLICQSIYNRYELGQQKDLNITIDVLDDVLERIEHEDADLKRRVDAIKGLSSVDLDVIFNLTRYPDWALDDIVELDESFRGEHRSQKAIERRRKKLAEKRDYFVQMGLMSGESDRCLIAGGEFVSLYLRFFYEIRKFGRLSRKLVLGKGPETPFSEKCDKLMTAVAYVMGQEPGFVNLIFHSYQRDRGDIIGTVRRRFSLLSDIRNGKHLKNEDLPLFNECWAVCELVGKPGKYQLLCLSVRNLDNPRELMQIELYFDLQKPIIVDLTALVNLLSMQANDAHVLIESYGDATVDLPDLPCLLKELSGVTLEQVKEKLPLVARWRLGSIQRVVHSGESTTAPEKEKTDDKEEDWQDWVSMYGSGKLEDAEEYLTKKLESTDDRVKRARLYNDLGYIKASDKLKSARTDLETALDLHFLSLALTLLNLSCLEIDETKYDIARELIEQALLITLARHEVEAAYLRLRLPENHLGFAVKWEEHPANVIEASYINLGYAILKWKGFEEALEVLEEGLELLPNSIRLKHALARLYLHEKRLDLASPIYRELAEMSGLPDGIQIEIKRLGSRVISTSRHSRRKR